MIDAHHDCAVQANREQGRRSRQLSGWGDPNIQVCFRPPHIPPVVRHLPMDPPKLNGSGEQVGCDASGFRTFKAKASGRGLLPMPK